MISKTAGGKIPLFCFEFLLWDNNYFSPVIQIGTIVKAQV